MFSGGLPAKYRHVSVDGLRSDCPHGVFPPFSAWCFFTLCILYLCLRIFSIGEKSPETFLFQSCSHFHTESKHGGQLQCLTMLAINHPLDSEAQRDMATIGNTLCFFFLLVYSGIFTNSALSDSLFYCVFFPTIVASVCSRECWFFFLHCLNFFPQGWCLSVVLLFSFFACTSGKRQTKVVRGERF